MILENIGNEQQQEEDILDGTAFGGIVRQIREMKSLSRDSLSELCNISTNYLGKIERGDEIPFLLVAIKISRALDICSRKTVKQGQFKKIDFPCIMNYNKVNNKKESADNTLLV